MESFRSKAVIKDHSVTENTDRSNLNTAEDLHSALLFTYSLEPGTPAVKLDGHLPEEIKQARRDELMRVQQEIAFRFGDSLVGYELDVIVDQHLEEDLWLGRTYADAPEIDANVLLTGKGIDAGDLIPVEIVGRQEYDLLGQLSADDE